MAATYTKSKGLKYFNVECTHSDTLELIIEMHGLLAYAIITRIWGKIYHEHGYYMNWDDKTTRLFAFKNKIDITYLKEVLASCFEEGLFNRDMFEKHQILTSEGIQKRWQKIVKEARRKDTTIDELFNLLPLDLSHNPKNYGVFAKNAEDLGKNAEDFDKGKRLKEKVKKEEEERKSECANAHTRTHEIFSFFNDLNFSEKKESVESESGLVAEKKEKEKNCAQKEKEKIRVRERVYLRPSEIDRLVAELGQDDYDFVINKVDFFKGAKGRTYRDDYCAIKSWGITALHEHKAKVAQKQSRMEGIMSNHYALMADYPAMAC